MIDDSMNKYVIEFDSSMEFCSDYPPNKEQDNWRGLRERYAECRATQSDTPLIPKYIHQIWLGGNMPAHYKEFIAKMKFVNPQMKHKLWDESNIDFELQTGDLIKRSKNFGQQSDILRYEILNKYGGIYVDLDFVAVRSFDSLLNHQFFTGIVYGAQPSLANGLIGCLPGHPIVKECLRRVDCNKNPEDLMEIMQKTGPFLLTKIFMELYSSHPGSVALPNTYFYPYPNDQKYKTLGEHHEQYIRSNTLCVHLWHCSWMKRRRQGKLGLIETIRNCLRGK